VRSRTRLLTAAQSLFNERGFDATTTRQIAERADVDAALIARYFGNKANLYLAAVAAEPEDEPEPSAEGIAAWAFRTTRHNGGPGAVLQALVRPDTDPEIRRASLERVELRLLGPLTDVLDRSGVAQPRLRAEIIVYAIVGLVIGRAQAGSALDEADHDELVRIVSAALGPVASGSEAG
jgi:AcrR family transcriptional regulator